MIRLAELRGLFEKLAPSHLAEPWDNSGLQVGRQDWTIESIWVSLDPLSEVVSAACKRGVDLLITHHPLIFHPLRSVDFGTPVGAIVQMAAEYRLAIYAMHTNLDSTAGGLNDVLAARIGLKNVGALKGSTASEESLKQHENDGVFGFEALKTTIGAQGLGRVGDLERPMELSLFAEMVKQRLGIETVRVAGDPALRITRAALCAGSGSSLMERFYSSGAQVYITGDLRYHDARAAEAKSLGLLDIGHFQSEHLIVDHLAERLDHTLKSAGVEVTVKAYRLETDPFRLI